MCILQACERLQNEYANLRNGEVTSAQKVSLLSRNQLQTSGNHLLLFVGAQLRDQRCHIAIANPNLNLIIII